jgi:hypothetical protein
MQNTKNTTPTEIRVRVMPGYENGMVCYTIYVLTPRGSFTSVCTVDTKATVEPTINWSGMGDRTAAFGAAFRDALNVGLEIIEKGPLVADEYSFIGDEMIG